MCSKCEPGYSEALFSTKCLLDKHCNQFWFIPLTGLLIFLYAMFLLFQNNFKDFVLGAPIGKQTMKKTLNSWMQARKHRKSRQQPKIVAVAEFNTTEHLPSQPVREDVVDTDEGGIFLILLFYYFQDADIVHFNPVYAKARDPIITLLKKFVGGLFKFQFDILVFAGNICPFPGLDPVSKVWLKLMFIPLLFVILTTVYCVGKITRKPVGFMQSCCHWRTTCHPHPFRMTCHPHPFQMTCHLHPFWMTCHLHCKETGLTSLKSQKQLTGQPDN